MDTGLYIHIPFCEKKCNYCNFCSVKADDALKKQYLDAVIAEAQARLLNTQINTVFVGGGTPSCLGDGDLTRLFNVLKFDKSNISEFTVEANPNSLTDSKIAEYKSLGVTRISLGVQSLNDKSLAAIGRLHNSAKALERLEILKSCGLDINVDYMIGLPFQTIEDVKQEISILCGSGINHLSCYSLILEQYTPMFELAKDEKLKLPDDDTAVDMYDAAKEIMESSGLKRYEISNFGKPCQHNLIYWRLNNYIGLGAAAHSFIDNVHSFNSDDIEEYKNYYLNSDNDCLKNNLYDKNNCGVNKNYLNYETSAHHAMFIEQSSDSDILQEYIMLGLRLDNGIDLIDMAERFGKKNVQKLLKISAKYSEYLNIEEIRIAIKPKFTYVSNGITADIIFDAIK